MDNLLDKFPSVEQNINLAQFTTFHIGGNAKYFLTSDDIDEIRNVIKFCKDNNIKYRVIGWGSNLLVSDDGFSGLILKINNKSLVVNNNIITAGAGVMLRKLIEFGLENNLIGYEFLAGIPGTIGGATYGNAGSYGKSISDIIDSVEVIDETHNIKILSCEECEFEYRESIFKKNNFIIFSVKLKLENGGAEESKKLIETRLLERSGKHPKEYNAGSFFKNIEITDEIVKNLSSYTTGSKKKIDISNFLKNGKIPAAYLIESLDLKNYCIRDACVSEIHGNFLINRGNAKAKDIIKLSEYIKKQVKKKYKIDLEEEVQYI